MAEMRLTFAPSRLTPAVIALVVGLLACATGCTLKPKCENGPGDVPGQCLPWPPPAPLINYGGL